MKITYSENRLLAIFKNLQNTYFNSCPWLVQKIIVEFVVDGYEPIPVKERYKKIELIEIFKRNRISLSLLPLYIQDIIIEHVIRGYPTDLPVSLRMYAVNYNHLRIMGGMFGLVYAN